MSNLNKRVKCVCPMCGGVNYVNVNSDDYDKWKSGMLIQCAFPYLDDCERELLMTGMCDDCWTKLIGND